MPRWLLNFFLFAMMAAFVIAVQRDTFVRRWIVREQVGTAKLREILPRVQIANQSLAQSAAELSRLADVPIEVDSDVIAADIFDLPHGTVVPREHSLRLKEVTLGDAIQSLLSQAAQHGNGPIVFPDGNRIRISNTNPTATVLVARVYDIEDILPPPGPKYIRDVQSNPGQALFQQGPTPAPLSDREIAAYRILSLLNGMLMKSANYVSPQSSSGAVNTAQPATMLNGRLIVVAPEEDQAMVLQLLYAFRKLGRLGVPW
jgi:hypothetical protein